MNKLERLRARIAELRSQITPLYEASQDDDFTDEQATELEELLGEAERTKADLDAEEKRAARLAELDTVAVAKTPAAAPLFHDRSTDPYDAELRFSPFDAPERVGTELRGRAFKAIEQERSLSDEHKETVTRLLERADSPDGALARHILVTGRDAYRSAWVKAMRGHEVLWTPEERDAIERQVAHRASVSTTDANGGYLIPFTLDPTVILTNDSAINPIREISRVVTTVTDNWHGVTSAGVTASYDAEGSEVSDDAPTFGQPTATVVSARAFVPHTIEAEMDISNLAGEVAMMFTDAKSRLEATAFTTGTGTGEPEGVVYKIQNTTASRVTATTNNSFGVPDIYKVIEAVPARHRASSSWMASLPIINLARQFATANNYHAYLTTLGEGSPSRLLNLPLYENSVMDSTIGTTDDDVLLAGNFSRYLIVDRVGLTVERVPHLFSTANGRPTGQRGWFAYWRNTALVLDTNAFRILRV